MLTTREDVRPGVSSVIGMEGDFSTLNHPGKITCVIEVYIIPLVLLVLKTPRFWRVIRKRRLRPIDFQGSAALLEERVSF